MGFELKSKIFYFFIWTLRIEMRPKHNFYVCRACSNL